MEVTESQRVLSAIESRILDIKRLMENESYINAFQELQSLVRNLQRIRPRISRETYISLSTALNNLMLICEENNESIGGNTTTASYQPATVFTGGK